jgi:hypothetical protein
MLQSKEAAVSTNQAGKIDPVLQLMQKYDIEMTRENYLYYAYMGEVPEEIGAEVEDGLPPEFRLENG